MKRSLLLIALFILLAVIPGTRSYASEPIHWSVGVVGGLQESGVSGILSTQSPLSFQMIVGNGFTGKIRYNISTQEYYFYYLDGFAGYCIGWDEYLLAGGGIGWEWDILSISDELPSLSISIEMNAGIMDDRFMIDPSVGLHYRF